MVRSFPHARIAHVAAAIFSAAMLVASAPGLSTVAAADDKLHSKHNQVRSEIAQAQGALDESSEALQTATRTLLDSRSALASAKASLAVAQAQADRASRTDALMRIRLQRAEQDLVVARQAAQTARQAVIAQRSAIGELAASNYATGDPALIGLSVMLRSQDASEATIQLNTVSSFMGRETTLLGKLRTARETATREESNVRSATKTVALQRQQAAANLEKKQSLEAQAALAKTQVATMFARNRAVEATAQRARSVDATQLRALKKQDEQIRQLILERARRQRGGYTGQTSGLLFQPVPGYITSPFGWRIHPVYGYRGFHDGTDFHAPCGTPVRSVSGGTVISKVWSSVYGNRLYVDLGKVNGKSMTAVYNHLDSYAVGNGQRVARGSMIARAGNTGWSTGCHLHITILVNGSPANPINYM